MAKEHSGWSRTQMTIDGKPIENIVSLNYVSTERYKRYMVFAIPYDEPSGGLSDCVGSYDSMVEVKTLFVRKLKKAPVAGSYWVLKNYEDWNFEVFDRVEGESIDMEKELKDGPNLY